MSGTNGTAENRTLPTEDLYRAVYEPQSVKLRADSEAGGPVMEGHFAVFNQWTEIDSVFEGRFLERVAPGAFRKTFKEQRERMRVLFQHGMDFQVGDKPLGPITDLREDDEGAYYEVPLLDAPYVREDILPGLRANLYGASFRFRVLREEIDDDPGTSDHNPHGLQERTIKEAQVMEFGPVTFPAYEGATAGVRSATDRFRRRDGEQAFELVLTEELQRDYPVLASFDRAKPVLVTLKDRAADPEQDDVALGDGEQDAPPKVDAEAQPHLDHGRRGKQTLYGLGSRKEKPYGI